MYKLDFDFAFGDIHVESFYNRVSEKSDFQHNEFKNIIRPYTLVPYALGLKSNSFVDIKFFN